MAQQQRRPPTIIWFGDSNRVYYTCVTCLSDLYRVSCVDVTSVSSVCVGWCVHVCSGSLLPSPLTWPRDLMYVTVSERQGSAVGSRRKTPVH